MKIIITIFIITCSALANNFIDATEHIPILTIFIYEGSIPPPSVEYRNDYLNPVFIAFANGTVIWRENNKYFQKDISCNTLEMMSKLCKIDLTNVDSSFDLAPLKADVPTLYISNTIGNGHDIKIRGIEADGYKWSENLGNINNSLPFSIVQLLKLLDNVCSSDFYKFVPTYLIAFARLSDSNNEMCTSGDFSSYNFIKIPGIGYELAYLITYDKLNKLRADILKCNNFRMDNHTYTIWYRFMMPGGAYEKKLIEIKGKEQ